MSGYNRKGRKPNGRGSGSTRSGRGSGRVYSSDRTSSIDQRIQSGFTGSSSKSWITDNSPLAGVLGGQMDPGSTTSNSSSHRLFEQFASPDTNILQNLQAFVDRLNNREEWTDEREDMYLQYLLQLISTADQRKFDRQQLEDSRLYSNPQNELARLMGSGISRDAAIQILSGSAGGSGVGSIIGSGQGVSVPSPTGIGGQLDLEKQQTTANIVFGAIDSLNMLLQSGMSMAQSVEQVKNLQAQNYWNQQQIGAFNSVQQVTQALQTMQSNGEIDPSEIEGLSNANDLIKFLQSKSQDNEQLKQLVSSPAYHQALGTTYGREFFNRNWSSMRDSRNAGDILDQYLRGLRLDNAAKQLQPDKIAAEIAQIGQQNKESEQRIIESCNKIALGNAQIEFLNTQGEWVSAQTNKTSSEIELLEAQITGQNTQNDILSLNYEYNSAGFATLKQNRIDALTLEAQKWNTIMHDPEYSPGYLKQMQSAWLNEASNAADASYVLSLYYQAYEDFALTHPGLYQLGTMFHESGMPQLLKVGGTVASPAAFQFLSGATR